MAGPNDAEIFDYRSVAQGAPYDRPTGDANQSRSVVISRHGMVATSQPLAAQVGLDVLKSGGNAADAAVAVSAMMGVVEPMSCGIGGDMFVIYWDAKTKKLTGLNASGRSPYAISRQLLADRKLKTIPGDGLLSWSVPGCVDGWHELLQRHGTRDLTTLLDPAISTAEEGFPVSEIIARSWRGSEKSLRRWPDSAATYLPNDHGPKTGEIVRLPNLGASYRLIAKEGRDAFYKGAIAKEIVAFSEKHDGLFSLKDFADHRSDWIEPVSTAYRGYRVWELPPNGQGIAALQILNLLEPYNIKKMGPGSPEYIHLYVEAKKLAFADRARFYADPSMAEVPTEQLISKAYADERRKLIDEMKAANDVPPGDPQLQHGDTIYLTVVDKDRNCCSFIQSNYMGFGSKIVPGNVGFAMQNRGVLFHLDADHPNRLEPHKRPFHTIIPAMVTRDDQPWFCFGVMGGDMQPQGHAQVLINMIDFDMNVQQAGDAARIRHLGSAQPTGKPAAGRGTVMIESGISELTAEALRQMGHKVVRAKGAFGGYQGIRIDWKNGTLHGGTDPRKDGAAVGY